ncbi:hypothetical protein VKS41_008760 [Umbelopsis sp. WA50703]
MEATIEEVSQPIDIDDEDASTEAAMVLLRILMDIDTSVELQQVPSVAAPTEPYESSTKKERARKPREPYRQYTAHQIEQVFNSVIEQGKTAKDAAFLAGINIRTAQHYVKKCNNDEERCLLFLIGYVDEPSRAASSKLRRALYSHFQPDGTLRHIPPEVYMANYLLPIG